MSKQVNSRPARIVRVWEDTGIPALISNTTCLLGSRLTFIKGPADATVTLAFTVGVPERLTGGIAVTVTDGVLPTFTVGVFTTLTFCVVDVPACPEPCPWAMDTLLSFDQRCRIRSPASCEHETTHP